MIITTLLLVTLGQDSYYQQQFDNQQYQNQQYRYEAQQQSQQANFAAQNQMLLLQHKAQMDLVKAQAASAAAKKKAPQKPKDVECRSVEFAGPIKPVTFEFDGVATVDSILRSADGTQFMLKVKFEGPQHTRVTGAELKILSISGLHLIAAGWKQVEFSAHDRRLRAHFRGIALFDATEDGKVASHPSECILIKDLVLETLWFD